MADANAGAKYPWFTADARAAVYDLWLRERGVISFPRLIKALAPCWQHDRYGTTDATALETLEWALAMTQDRIGMQPEWIAADWARWRRLAELDPWQRYAVLARQLRGTA